MANQRKKGIERVTLTLPDTLLAELEADAAHQGKDRLAIMRQALADYVESRRPRSKSSEAKPKPPAKKRA